ncbi:LOW QUALITY PROTEIN: conserved oligomeric Golgi complex subunit 6 [Megalobrama amblycephala]|nr:LOW QUALITY PROTEIN: conserved oligomeric Golgi complex subunit 6 [Megalobrama amblycephala]
MPTLNISLPHKIAKEPSGTHLGRGTKVFSTCGSGTFFWLLKTASWRLTWMLMMAETKADLSTDASNLHTSNSSGNVSSQTNNPLSRKLNKILETRLENDKEMLEALKSLSVFFTENSLRTRRNLRGDIERRSLSINEEFVRIFKEVTEELESVHEDVQAMSSCCEEMTNRLKAAKEQTQDLIVKTNKLQGENHRLEVRAQVAQAFLSKFQLSAAEMATLRSARDGPITEDFFRALNRVKNIHEDVKVLLRTNQQTAGLEIMEQMAVLQETAYEQLYRWAQNECRGLTQETCDIPPVLSQAMESLQDRPVLYKYTLDEFGTARRSSVVRGFIDALTRGGPGGTPRPIEMHSHDPMRYVGDMLAWLHQATASEKEHLEALLKQVTVQGVEENMQEVVGHITEGVCRPLKVRIEQVIIAEPGAVLLYKLSNLLKFYHHTISGIMGTSVSSLLMTIDEMHMLSKKMFFNSLSLHASRLMDKVELPPPDLGPTASLTQTLSLLREVLASHDSSVLPLDARQADFAQVLSCILDPLLQLCTVSASNLGTADMATYMVNSLYMMKTTLALFEFTDKRLEMLEFQIEAHLDTLINEQATFVLTRAALSHIYSCVQQHTAEQGPLANLPGMDSTSLKTAMVQFDRYLASPDTLVMPQLNFLLSAAIKEQIFKQSTELVCRAYGEVYKAVTNPTNAYKDAESVLHRSPQQVQTLLS